MRSPLSSTRPAARPVTLLISVLALGWALGATASCSDDDSPGTGGGTTTPTGTGGSAGDGGTGGATGGTGGATGGTGGATGGTGGATGGTGGGSGGSESGWAETPPELTNDADCDWPLAVTPAVGEAGHLFAARLTPPSYPYEVTEIHYELIGDDPCDSTFAHRVELYVDTAVAPPNSPATIVQLDAPATSVTASVRVVQLPVNPPITLQSGEHLFVAVELPTVETACIAACDGAPAWDRDYWSNATAPDYSWVPMSDFQMYVHGRIGANGTAQ